MDTELDAPLLDVGSGPGLPGLVLAACQPARPCVLLDRVGKKTRFVVHAAAAMGLANVTAVHSRVEAHRAATAAGYPSGAVSDHCPAE